MHVYGSLLPREPRVAPRCQRPASSRHSRIASARPQAGFALLASRQSRTAADRLRRQQEQQAPPKATAKKQHPNKLDILRTMLLGSALPCLGSDNDKLQG